MRTGQRSGVSERSAPEWESDHPGGSSHPIAPSAPAAPPVLAGLPMGSATSRARASDGAGNADLPAAGRRFQRTIFSPDPDKRPYLKRHYDCFAAPTAEADMDAPESSGTLPPVAGPLSRRMSEDGYELDTAAPHHALSEALSLPSGQFRDSQVLSTNSFSRRDPTSSGSMRPHHTSSAPVMPYPAPPLETPFSMRPRAAHQSEVSGVSWNEQSNRWLVRIKGPRDSEPQSVSFPINRYGNDVDRARQAAEQRATEIRAGTYVHQPRPKLHATYQSAVQGVSWNTSEKRWQVRIKGFGDSKPQSATFPAAKYGGDVDSARQAAELCAAQLRAGTYVPQPRSLSEYQSAVSGVSWNERNNRWIVQVKDPHGGKPHYVSFSIARYGNDLARARQAAEQCATDIRAGRYERQSTR